MLLTRWKLMAGVLGVSIGGLAAAASQCPKLDKSKGRQPDAPVTAEALKVPPAGAPSAPPKLPEPPTPSAGVPKLPEPPTPSAPQLTPAGVTPPATPLVVVPDAKIPAPPAPVTDLPKVPAAAASTLPLIDFPAPTQEPKAAKPEEKAPPALPLIADVPPAPPVGKPTTPMTPPKPLTAPANDLTLPPPPKPTVLPDLGPPAATNQIPGKPTSPPPIVNISGTQPVPDVPAPGGTMPPVEKPSVPGTNAANPPSTPPALPTEKLPVLSVPDEVLPSKLTAAPAEAGAVKVGAMKYRILLRVGEGEPTFEVKSGDDLVFKVACEKVDIKSPEKGAGLSAVTARGKVRFAGFGVEGTCDELSFMAGTGEVSMTGEVKVQMKDKLGRVESELSTSTLKYKIDANVVGASIKP